MKNWIFLIILGVVGYFFSYQYFIGSSEQDAPPGEPTFDEYMPPFPEECEEKGETLEDAINGHELGKLTIVELNQHTRRFQSCLRDAGFTDSQINRTYDRIEESALSTDPSNSRGWSD